MHKVEAVEPLATPTACPHSASAAQIRAGAAPRCPLHRPVPCPNPFQQKILTPTLPARTSASGSLSGASSSGSLSASFLARLEGRAALPPEADPPAFFFPFSADAGALRLGVALAGALA